MQRILFITAVVITASIGGFLAFGQADMLQAHDSRTDHKKSDCRTKGDTFRRNHQDVYPNCKVTPTPVPSTSQSGSPTPGVSPSPDDDDDNGGTPSGEKEIVYQGAWKSKSASAAVASSLASDKWCTSKKTPVATPIKVWESYLDAKGIRFTKSGQVAQPNGTGGPANHYIISNIFESGGDTATWESMYIAYKYMSGTIRVAYRVSDSPTAVTSPTDSSWITLAIPRPSNQTSCKIQFGGAAKAFVSTYALNKEGKYFQYKISIDGNFTSGFAKQQLDWVRFNVQPIGDGGDDDDDDDTDASPSPTTSVSPSTSPGTPSPTGKTGKITVVTKRIVGEASPSPIATGTPKVSPKPAQPCTDNRETEPAPNVGLAVEQTAGGETLVEDQETDETGTWRGIGGEIDDFPTGTYKIEIGDLDNVDYKLVAICVTPDSNRHYLKTQTDPNNGRTTIFVVGGLETKVTALFAPRSKPYLTVSSFLLDGADLIKAGTPSTPSPQPNTVSTTTSTGRKVLRLIYPGQKVLRYVKWQNTGEATAKDVVIQDAILNEFSITDDIEERYGVTLTVSGEKRTISKKVGDVVKGGQGSIMYAMTLRADAFDSGEPNITNANGGTSLE